MAMEPTTMMMAASLATSLLGSGMQYKAQNDAIKAQQKQARKAAYNQLRLQDEANAQVEQTASQYDPETREAVQAEEEAKYADYLLDSVVGAREDSSLGLNAPISGKVSEDYLIRRAAADAENTARTAKYAQMLGKIAGPTKLRDEEAIKLGDLASNIAMTRNFSGGQSAVDQMGIQAAGQANPGLIAAGGVLQGAAPAVGRYAGKFGTPPIAPLPVSRTGGYPVTQHGGFTYNIPNITALR